MRFDTLAHAIRSTIADIPASHNETLLSSVLSAPRPGTMEVLVMAIGEALEPSLARRCCNIALACCSAALRLLPGGNRPTTASQSGPRFSRQSGGLEPVADT